MSVTVTTQDELNAALANKEDTIFIDSPDGLCLILADPGSSHVEAWGSSHVEAKGSSHVEARGSSHVLASGSSHVEAWDSSHVLAWDSSHVKASGSSHVEAWGSSHVLASGSSHVEAWGSSHVEAGKYVAVHLHSQQATLDAQGVVIDCTSIDLTDVAQWADYTGTKVTDHTMVLFKAVNGDGRSGLGFEYPIGETVTADDYVDDNPRGGGLHLSPSVSQALTYHPEATRFLACRARLEDVSPIDGSKVKVRSCEVLHEVDRYGKPLHVEVT